MNSEQVLVFTIDLWSFMNTGKVLVSRLELTRWWCLQPLYGYGVAKVLDSEHQNFKKGDLVWGTTGWEEYTLITQRSTLSELKLILCSRSKAQAYLFPTTWEFLVIKFPTWFRKKNFVVKFFSGRKIVLVNLVSAGICFYNIYHFYYLALKM